jgi:hypothetical protein
VDLPAVDLFASLGRPVASELKAGANIQPEPPSCVFSGTPVLLFGEVDEALENQIELSWKGGKLKLPVHFPENDSGETVWLLQGSRLITDWESRYPSSEALAPLAKRQESRVAARLIALSQTYGLASREMSLVAIVTRQGDRAGELPQTRVVPVGMAQDVEFQSYFPARTLAAASVMDGMSAITLRERTKMPLVELNSFRAMAPPDAHGSGFRDLLLRSFPGSDHASLASSTETAEEILLDLAARMESDGGMPGQDAEERASASVVALLAFLSQGHSQTSGAFRSHVVRLIGFLKSLTGLSSQQHKVVAAVIELASKGTAPAGEWTALAHTSGMHWGEVERAVLDARA